MVGAVVPEETDSHDDECAKCHRGGFIICCDSCSRSYHPKCASVKKAVLEDPESSWFCPECVRAGEEEPPESEAADRNSSTSGGGRRRTGGSHTKKKKKMMKKQQLSQSSDSGKKGVDEDDAGDDGLQPKRAKTAPTAQGGRNSSDIALQYDPDKDAVRLHASKTCHFCGQIGETVECNACGHNYHFYCGLIDKGSLMAAGIVWLCEECRPSTSSDGRVVISKAADAKNGDLQEGGILGAAQAEHRQEAGTAADRSHGNGTQNTSNNSAEDLDSTANGSGHVTMDDEQKRLTVRDAALSQVAQGRSLTNSLRRPASHATNNSGAADDERRIKGPASALTSYLKAMGIKATRRMARWAPAHVDDQDSGSDSNEDADSDGDDQSGDAAENTASGHVPLLSLSDSERHRVLQTLLWLSEGEGRRSVTSSASSDALATEEHSQAILTVLESHAQESISSIRKSSKARLLAQALVASCAVLEDDTAESSEGGDINAPTTRKSPRRKAAGNGTRAEQYRLGIFRRKLRSDGAYQSSCADDLATFLADIFQAKRKAAKKGKKPSTTSSAAAKKKAKTFAAGSSARGRVGHDNSIAKKGTAALTDQGKKKKQGRKSNAADTSHQARGPKDTEGNGPLAATLGKDATPDTTAGQRRVGQRTTRHRHRRRQGSDGSGSGSDDSDADRDPARQNRRSESADTRRPRNGNNGNDGSGSADDEEDRQGLVDENDASDDDDDIDLRHGPKPAGRCSKCGCKLPVRSVLCLACRRVDRIKTRKEKYANPPLADASTIQARGGAKGNKGRRRNSKRGSGQLAVDSIDGLSYVAGVPVQRVGNVKPLETLCVSYLAASIDDVMEFGDIPELMLDTICAVVCKRNRLDDITVPLFATESRTKLNLYDCANLSNKAYQRIFGIGTNLTVLNLVFCGQLADHEIQLLPGACPLLVELRVKGAFKVTDEKMASVVAGLEKLMRFEVANTSNIGQHTLAALSKKPGMESLEFFQCTSLSDRHLARISTQKALTKLVVSQCELITDRAVRVIAESCGQELTSLDLSGLVQLTDLSLFAIVAKCTKLRHLELGYLQQVTDEGIYALANAPFSLHILNLKRCINISDDVLEECLQAHRRTLAELSLHSLDGITHEAAKSISKCTHLQRLDLSHCRSMDVDNEMLEELAESCPLLREVRVWGLARVTVPFVEGFPNIQLVGCGTFF